MDVEIIKQNGQSFRLSDYGVVQDFVVHSVDRSVVRDPIEGRVGNADYGVEIGDRTIEVPFIFKASYNHHYAHLRDFIFGILDDDEPFYVREMRRVKSLQYDFRDFGQEPKWSSQTDNQYVNGKQYRVRLNSSIKPNQEGLNGEVNLEFVTSGSPYAETIYTTKELNDTGYDAMVGKYGLVDDIHIDRTQYVFTDNVFEVYNAGNVTIEPEYMYLYITLGLVTTDSSLKLTNKTTGETFEFRKAVTDRNIYLDGMNIMEGTAINALRNTNRQRIKLVPGVNKFEITGATFSQITFNTRYYYK